MMIQHYIDFSTKIIENGSEGEITKKRKTKFNEFGCDKVHKIPKEEIYRFMNSIEIYATRDIMGRFRMNGEVIRGVKL